MKFKIRVGNAGSKDTWWEEYERDGDNAQAEADAITSRWNDHLQQGEKPRTLHEVVVIDAEKSPSNHKCAIYWKQNMKTCDNCGGSFSRYGLFNCNKGHKKPTLAEKIVREIESDLNDRRGMGLDNIDDETAWEIRDTWAKIINKHIKTKGKAKQ